jgi:hypothetical protein
VGARVPDHDNRWHREPDQPEKKMNGRLKSFLIFLGLVAIILLLTRYSRGHSQQYQIQQVCNQKCKSKHGYIAITEAHLYIKYDSILTEFNVVEISHYRQATYYKLTDEYYSGIFLLTDGKAFLDVHLFGCCRVSEIYYLKK